MIKAFQYATDLQRVVFAVLLLLVLERAYLIYICRFFVIASVAGVTTRWNGVLYRDSP